MTNGRLPEEDKLIMEVEEELKEVTKTFIKLLKDFQEKGIITNTQYNEMIKEKKKFLEG
ncbi:hypothetical protein [Alkaliphilus serpentinus]|uniref:hypothetical protein n=1 Tax=Alkaliphilus serpentinus TaxID=1482731 RepID=UPI00186588D5|nr:hypothetical protein [Alkaliphilus serpentinus]